MDRGSVDYYIHSSGISYGKEAKAALEHFLNQEIRRPYHLLPFLNIIGMAYAARRQWEVHPYTYALASRIIDSRQTTGVFDRFVKLVLEYRELLDDQLTYEWLKRLRNLELRRPGRCLNRNDYPLG